MPVRGSTEWQHAKIQRYVINFDAGGIPMICMWDECDRKAFELYKHVSCEHDIKQGSCQYWDMQAYVNSGRTAHTNFVFCSEGHRDYFVNAKGRNAHESIARTGRAYGNLPTGKRNLAGYR